MTLNEVINFSNFNEQIDRVSLWAIILIQSEDIAERYHYICPSEWPKQKT